MKKITNYDELIKMVDIDSLDRIFTEHLMLMIAKNKRLTDMDNNCAVMTDDEVSQFVDNLECRTLTEELNDLSNPKYKNIRNNIPYPRYIKGVLDTLKYLGYAESWIEETLKILINDKYLK